MTRSALKTVLKFKYLFNETKTSFWELSVRLTFAPGWNAAVAFSLPRVFAITDLFALETLRVKNLLGQDCEVKCSLPTKEKRHD